MQEESHLGNTNSKALLSIVIPCFNHGRFIQETLNSIDARSIRYPFEIIIVDDGSTDEATLQKLAELQTAGYRVIQQTNGGPAKARNTGVEQAQGKYILPVDADNKIKPDYINKAIPLLENDTCDIVYAQPEFFGDTKVKKRQYKVRAFDDLAIVTGNCADACAVYRKEVWIRNKGYDTAIPYHGFEDWEFWIHASANGFRFHLIKEKLFYYRIVTNSVVSGYDNNQRILDNHRYIARKHSDFFLEKLVKLAYVRERYDIDILRFPLAPFIYLLYWLGILERPVERARKKLSWYMSTSK